MGDTAAVGNTSKVRVVEMVDGRSMVSTGAQRRIANERPGSLVQAQAERRGATEDTGSSLSGGSSEPRGEVTSSKVP